MSKLTCVVLALLLLCLVAVPAHAQHRSSCFGGGCRVGVGYGSFGYGSVATFASPFTVAVPFVPTVSVAVPVAVSVPVATSISAPQVVASPVISAPAFPVATSSPLVGVGQTFAVVEPTYSVPYCFGVSHRTFRHRR